MRIPSKLFWRIYLFGLLLIVAATIAAILPSIIVEPNSHFHGNPHRVRDVLTRALKANLGDSAKLQITLDNISSIIDSSAAVYTRQGGRLAASGFNPPLPLDNDNMRYIGSWRSIRANKMWVYAMPLGDDNAPYLVIDGKGGGLQRLLLALSSVLLVVGILSWPLARAITRPLEKLRDNARALAGGNLSARSGVVRRDEVGELASTLDNMADRLEERIRNEKELLANISHEIRTPLARLKVALELCEDAPGDARETLERLEGMSADLAELERLVDNVLASARLDLASSESANIPIRLKKISLEDFFENVRGRFARHYSNRTLEVTKMSRLVDGTLDPDLFNRVCDNLLNNAVKYSPPESRIILSISQQADSLSLEVTDFGQGVMEEDLPRLFDPFFRSDRSRSRKTGGTGLGLTLCKRIVEAHGGKISAQANPGKGLTIALSIPV